MNDSKQKRNVSGKRLRSLILLAIKYDLTRLKVGDVEFERPKGGIVIEPSKKSNETIKEDESMPTGDELLFYATPTFDQIQEQKKREPK